MIVIIYFNYMFLEVFMRIYTSTQAKRDPLLQARLRCEYFENFDEASSRFWSGLSADYLTVVVLTGMDAAIKVAITIWMPEHRSRVEYSCECVTPGRGLA